MLYFFVSNTPLTRSGGPKRIKNCVKKLNKGIQNCVKHNRACTSCAVQTSITVVQIVYISAE